MILVMENETSSSTKNYLIIVDDIETLGLQSRGFVVFRHDLGGDVQRNGPWTAHEELVAQALAEELQRRLGSDSIPLPDAAGVGTFTGDVVQPANGRALAGGWGARGERGDGHQAASRRDALRGDGRMTPEGQSVPSGQCSENQRSAL
jgi:hypothetical protein